MCFGSGAGAAAEALIQDAATGDITERGKRFPVGTSVPPGPVSCPKSAQPLPMQSTALCVFCQKQEEMGGKKQLSDAGVRTWFCRELEAAP